MRHPHRRHHLALRHTEGQSVFQYIKDGNLDAVGIKQKSELFHDAGPPGYIHGRVVEKADRFECPLLPLQMPPLKQKSDVPDAPTTLA